MPCVSLTEGITGPFRQGQFRLRQMHEELSRAPLARRITFLKSIGRPAFDEAAYLFGRFLERLQRVAVAEGIGIRVLVHTRHISPSSARPSIANPDTGSRRRSS